MGFKIIDVPRWTVVAGLGCGRFSQVYSCKASSSSSREGKYALKYFDIEAISKYNVEITLLNGILKQIVNVPKIIDTIHTDTFGALVIAPLGVSCLPCPLESNITPRMLISILKSLQTAHQLNIIHRDVKPDNLYLNRMDNNEIILNDWSSSVEKGFTYPYEGTPLYGDPPELDGTHIPSVALDLRSFVRTAFSLSKQRIPLVENTHPTAQQYWAQVEKDYPQFQNAMTAASSENYRTLETLLLTQW